MAMWRSPSGSVCGPQTARPRPTSARTWSTRCSRSGCAAPAVASGASCLAMRTLRQSLSLASSAGRQLKVSRWVQLKGLCVFEPVHYNSSSSWLLPEFLHSKDKWYTSTKLPDRHVCHNHIQMWTE